MRRFVALSYGYRNVLRSPLSATSAWHTQSSGRASLVPLSLFLNSERCRTNLSGPVISDERRDTLEKLFFNYGAKNKTDSIAVKSLVQNILKNMNLSVTPELRTRLIQQGFGEKDDPSKLDSSEHVKKLTEEHLTRIVQTAADSGKDGKINFNEFCYWFEPLADTDISVENLLDYWSRQTELKDPKILFENVWKKLTSKKGEGVRFPAEICWLGGAPGAGKGTNTPFILRERGITAEPIILSSLLNTPAMQKIKDQGFLVSDEDALYSLLEELVHPKYASGAVVDGFPRTSMQVTFLKLLRDKMNVLQHDFPSMDLPRPAFRIIVLYVNEAESVRRQLTRGKRAMAHNEKVRQSGVGKILPVRETDVSITSARRRYKVFSEQALEALQSLQNEFPYHVIDATGTIEQVEMEIVSELAYQSSLDLAHETYEAIRAIPTSKHLVQNARQRLVRRLDEYQRVHNALFTQVIDLIQQRFIPVLTRHALSGAARVVIKTEDPYASLLDEDLAPLVVDMVIDILADRDFNVHAFEQKATGSVFEVRFHTPGLVHKHDK